MEAQLCVSANNVVVLKENTNINSTSIFPGARKTRLLVIVKPKTLTSHYHYTIYTLQFEVRSKFDFAIF